MMNKVSIESLRIENSYELSKSIILKQIKNNIKFLNKI